MAGNLVSGGEAEAFGISSARYRAEEITEIGPSSQQPQSRVVARAAETIPEEEARTFFHGHFSNTSSIIHHQEDASLSSSGLSPTLSPTYSIVPPSSANSDTSVSTQSGRVNIQQPEIVDRVNHFERINRASDPGSRRHRPARQALEPSPHRHRLIPLRRLVLHPRPVLPPVDRRAQPMAAHPNQNQARSYTQAAYTMPNGAPGAPGAPTGPVPGAAQLLPNQGRVLQHGPVRVLCIADVRGNLRSLNDLARDAKADYIIHTGDFGFYDHNSLDRIAEKTLRHVAQYSPLLSDNVKRQIGMSPAQSSVKERFAREQLPLSELPLFLNNTYKLDVPVYTVWGACEDVAVLEKLKSNEYSVPNLFIIDEAHSRLLDIGGVKLRLLGLGGAIVMHKLFDNGEGKGTIAGGQGTMWTTLLQMGELVDTAQRVYDPTETRIFITHASPAREGLLNQLSVTLKADFSISAGLHFRYGSSYNEFSVNPTLDHYRGKLASSKASFDDVWQTVKNEVEPQVSDNDYQSRLLKHALELVEKMPTVANGGNPFGGSAGVPGSGQIDESAFKNMWNFNLADAAYGWLVLDIESGRIGTEMRAQGFNFAHRTGKAPQQAEVPPVAPSQPMAARVHQPRATPPVPANRGPQGNRAAASPQPAKDAGKPLPPAPSSNTPDPKTNGAAASEKMKPETPPAERKQSQAIFIRNAKDEEEARSVVHDDDKAKIDRVEKSGQFLIMHFKSPDDMTAALKRVPQEYKTRDHNDNNKMLFSVYSPRQSNWGPSNRGSFRSGSAGNSGPGAPTPPGAPGASDSETGRGGFRGGRGRGGRSGDRGGRGGGGGGRGGGPRVFSSSGGPKPAGDSPAPSSAPAPAPANPPPASAQASGAS